MGYTACEDALQHNKALSGSIGAGIGATVGKIYGMERSSKSGLGVCALEVGDLRVAAIVVVNALGDICNPENGEKLAGLKNEAGTGFADSREALYTISKRATLFNSNTTIGVVITNGEFTKGEMNKLAAMTRSAYARCIRPGGNHGGRRYHLCSLRRHCAGRYQYHRSSHGRGYGTGDYESRDFRI